MKPKGCLIFLKYLVKTPMHVQCWLLDRESPELYKTNCPQANTEHCLYKYLTWVTPLLTLLHTHKKSKHKYCWQSVSWDSGRWSEVIGGKPARLISETIGCKRVGYTRRSQAYGRLVFQSGGGDSDQLYQFWRKQCGKVGGNCLEEILQWLRWCFWWLWFSSRAGAG